MKTTLLKWFNALLATLLTAFGFGCKPGGDVIPAYGVPQAEFKFNVNASDALSNKVVKGLKVSVANAQWGNTDVLQVDTTDADGNAYLHFYDYPADTLKLTIDDVDGAENGNYNEYVQVVTIKPDEYEGGSGWISGTVTKSIDAKMDPKP